MINLTCIIYVGLFGPFLTISSHGWLYLNVAYLKMGWRTAGSWKYQTEGKGFFKDYSIICSFHQCVILGLWGLHFLILILRIFLIYFPILNLNIDLTGKEAVDQIQQSYPVFPLSNSTSQERHVQPSMHAPPFASGSRLSVDSAISLADQPLDFAPRFNRDTDLQMQSTYNHHDSSTSMNNWAAPVAPGVGYPSIPPILASGPQVLILKPFVFLVNL